MEDNIFNQEDHPNEATAHIAKKHNSVTEQIKGMRNAIHDLSKDLTNTEPDWDRMLANAKDSLARMQVREARSAYQDELKYKAWEQVQVQNDNKINSILAMPLHSRNKSFYDNLQKTDPNSYWSTKVQAQRRRDKETMGLAYHLRGGSK